MSQTIASPAAQHIHAKSAAAPRLQYLYNGNIITMRPGDAGAAPHMLLCVNRIWSCSDDAAPLGLDYRRTGFSAARSAMAGDVDFVDLEGRTVLPGLVDSHVHFIWWAINQLRADLSPARSEQEALEILRKHSGDTPAGEWIIGMGWCHNLWHETNLPTSASLDKVFPDNPVILSSKCGHLTWVNSAAIQRAKLSASTPDPAGGEIERTGENGKTELTGIFKETAISLIEQHIAEPDYQTRLAALRSGQKLAHSMGITGMQTPEYLDTWGFLQKAHDNGDLNMRINFWIPVAALDDLERLRISHGLGDDWLRISAVKLFTDGSLGGRTALMYEPYENEPENCGICVTDEAELIRRTLQANRLGLSMAVHAIGDKAIGSVITAYEQAQRQLGTSEPTGRSPLPRNRIEHLQVFAEKDLERLRRLKPIASMQPVHLCADMGPADHFWGSRGKRAYAFRTLAEAGVPLVFGSDAPVEPINPFFGIFAAVTRRNLAADESSTWYADEKISIDDALRAYTATPALASGQSDRLGTLAPGMLADFIVLDEDPHRVAPDDLRHMKPIATFTDGKCVHSAWDRLESSSV